MPPFWLAGFKSQVTRFPMYAAAFMIGKSSFVYYLDRAQSKAVAALGRKGGKGARRCAAPPLPLVRAPLFAPLERQTRTSDENPFGAPSASAATST